MTRSKQSRRWLQFNLKSLMLVFLVVASFLAGRVSVMRQLDQLRTEAERQRAIAEVNEARALEAAYQAQVQLAHQVLSSTATDTLRQELLELAKEQIGESSEEAAGVDQQDP